MLHCSGNKTIVKYLVDYETDINADDGLITLFISYDIIIILNIKYYNKTFIYIYTYISYFINVIL